MSKQLTMDDIFKRNPQLDRKAVERMRQLAEPASDQERKRVTAPDRLSVGDSSQTRKVRLRYTRQSTE